MRYKPKSLEERGLRNYLEATRAIHGDNGYEDFALYADIANLTKLAELFCVKRPTIYRWLRVYKKEKTNANRTSNR